MPSDSNGIYSLPNGYLAVTGTTILASQHNPPLEDLAAAMTQRLMANGANPMTAPLKFSTGSAAAPSATFNSAPTSGMYWTGTTLGFAIGGVKVAELATGGFKQGGHFVGELIPWSGTTAPAFTVLAYGQTLSRTTYADLWAFAQTEIAAGNTFYNNGNGTTTFGIGDLRGRTLAGKEDMGGSSAFRLSSTYFGANPQTMGAGGGTESKTLVTANLPPYTPAGTNSGGSSTFSASIQASAQSGATATVASAIQNGTGLNTTINPQTVQPTFTGTAQGGTSTPFSLVQPTLICSYLLFAGA